MPDSETSILMKCQGTGKICSLHQGFVSSNTSIQRILEKTTKNEHYIQVELIINLQNLAFLDLNNYRNNISVLSYI